MNEQNEHASIPEGKPTTEVATSATPASDSSKTSEGPGRVLLYGIVIVLALLLAGHWWYAKQQMEDLRGDVARRVQTAETASTEARNALQSVQDALKSVQARVNVIESRQSETQSQQLALEQLYQDLARTRDEWALAEIEQVLSTANQQLQLAGNVQGAIIALQNADARLAQTGPDQFIRIRNAIARDLEQLKALPSVDLTNIALRLDSAINQIDSMPLLADALPPEEPMPPRLERRPAPPVDSGQEADWLSRLENIWQRWSSEVWSEIRQVIRVREVETTDALLLSPPQAFYLRENLKLRLLNARMALLARNETAFRNDLMMAQDAIARYFDTRARPSQAVQALLRQVQSTQLSIEIPTLSESLNAVRNHKSAPIVTP